MKEFIISLYLGLFLLLLTGCAGKPMMSTSYGGKERVVRDDVIGKMIIVQGKEAWRSPSDGYNKSTRNIHLLQNTADATINEGYSYFAFVVPVALSSDGELAMINNAEEYIKNCAPSAIQAFTIGNARCGITTEYPTATAVFYAFKEQPKYILSYDAKEVKKYLINHEQYREDGYKKVDVMDDYTISNIPTLYSATKY